LHALVDRCLGAIQPALDQHLAGACSAGSCVATLFVPGGRCAGRCVIMADPAPSRLTC